MDHMDGVFKALADEHRRRIVAALCQEPAEAGSLAGAVGLAPNAVSFHLKALKAADLVTVRRRGRHLVYQLQPETLHGWLEGLAQRFGLPQLNGEQSERGQPEQTQSARKPGNWRSSRPQPGSFVSEQIPEHRAVSRADEDSAQSILPTELL